MNKTRLLAALCLLAFAVGSITFGRHGQPLQRSQEPAAQDQTAGELPPEVPDEVAYKHLFNHVTAFKKEAEKVERAGKNPEPFKGYFKRKAGLSDDQVRLLDEIAAEGSLEVAALDTKARAIVKAYLAQYPGGQVPHGEKPAPRPPGLRAMAEERERLILHARDRLRSAFGEEEFIRFNKFVKRRIAPNVHAGVAQQAPSAPSPDEQQPQR